MPIKERRDAIYVRLKGRQVAVTTVGHYQNLRIGAHRAQLVEIRDWNDGVTIAVDEHQRCCDVCHPVRRSKVLEPMSDGALHRLEDHG